MSENLKIISALLPPDGGITSRIGPAKSFIYTRYGIKYRVYYDKNNQFRIGKFNQSRNIYFNSEIIIFHLSDPEIKIKVNKWFKNQR